MYTIAHSCLNTVLIKNSVVMNKLILSSCVMISIFLVWPMSVRKSWPSLTHVEAIEHFNVLFHVCQIFCAYVSTVSQSDCYVRLWLPTASDEIFHTKTIKNCRNPVWNETFYFRIQRQVKVNSPKPLFFV